MKAFRELLLRKSSDVSSILENLSDEQLTELVAERLEKMARPVSLNASLRDFYDHLTPRDTMALRAAMGHHASHYKHFLDKGDTKNANKHAEQFMKLGHIAHKMNEFGKGDGKFDFDAPPIQAWQRNAAEKPGDVFYDKTRGGPDVPGWNAHSSNKRQSGPDRDNHHLWLGEPPHSQYHHRLLANPGKDANGDPEYHDSAYPMEHVKINGKYINVSPVTDEPASYREHIFDKHPGVAWAFHQGESSHSGAQAQKYQEQLADFNAKYRDNLVASLKQANAIHDGSVVGSRIHSTTKRTDLTGGGAPSVATDNEVKTMEAGIQARTKALGDLHPSDRETLSAIWGVDPKDIRVHEGQAIKPLANKQVSQPIEEHDLMSIVPHELRHLISSPQPAPVAEAPKKQSEPSAEIPDELKHLMG